MTSGRRSPPTAPTPSAPPSPSVSARDRSCARADPARHRLHLLTLLPSSPLPPTLIPPVALQRRHDTQASVRPPTAAVLAARRLATSCFPSRFTRTRIPLLSCGDPLHAAPENRSRSRIKSTLQRDFRTPLYSSPEAGAPRATTSRPTLASINLTSQYHNAAHAPPQNGPPPRRPGHPHNPLHHPRPREHAQLAILHPHRRRDPKPP